MKNAKEEALCHAKGLDKEKEKEKAGNQQVSKASTVEMAIDYIKALKQELEETKGKLKVAETRLETTKTSADGTAGSENGPLKNSVQGETNGEGLKKNGFAQSFWLRAEARVCSCEMRLLQGETCMLREMFYDTTF